MEDRELFANIFGRVWGLVQTDIEPRVGQLERKKRAELTGVFCSFVFGYEDFRRPRNDGKTWDGLFKEWLKDEHGRMLLNERGIIL